MEAIERHDADVEGVIDKDEESIEEVEPHGEVDPVRFLKLVVAANSRPWSEVSTYDGSLNVEELIVWTNRLDKYFNYEELDEDKRVKFVMTKLRGHAFLWWDRVQVDQ